MFQMWRCKTCGVSYSVPLGPIFGHYCEPCLRMIEHLETMLVRAGEVHWMHYMYEQNVDLIFAFKSKYRA